MDKAMVARLALCTVLLLGTYMMAKAQEKKPMILEVTTFKVKPGTAKSKFAARDASVEREYTAKQPGFIKRLSGVDENGTWVVIVYWETMRDAEASMAKFMGDASVADYAAMIDGPTMKMNRYESN